MGQFRGLQKFLPPLETPQVEVSVCLLSIFSSVASSMGVGTLLAYCSAEHLNDTWHSISTCQVTRIITELTAFVFGKGV